MGELVIFDNASGALQHIPLMGTGKG